MRHHASVVFHKIDREATREIEAGFRKHGERDSPFPAQGQHQLIAADRNGRRHPRLRAHLIDPGVTGEHCGAHLDVALHFVAGFSYQMRRVARSRCKRFRAFRYREIPYIQRNRKRPCESLGVVKRHLELHMAENDAAGPVGHAQIFGVRRSAEIQPGPVIESGGLHHERISIPSPHRVS